MRGHITSHFIGISLVDSAHNTTYVILMIKVMEPFPTDQNSLFLCYCNVDTHVLTRLNQS